MNICSASRRFSFIWSSFRGLTFWSNLSPRSCQDWIALLEIQMPTSVWMWLLLLQNFACEKPLRESPVNISSFLSVQNNSSWFGANLVFILKNKTSSIELLCKWLLWMLIFWSKFNFSFGSDGLMKKLIFKWRPNNFKNNTSTYVHKKWPNCHISGHSLMPITKRSAFRIFCNIHVRWWFLETSFVRFF